MRETTKKRITTIWIACAAGAKDAKEISGMTGLDKERILSDKHVYKLPVPGVRNRNVEKVNGAIAKGAQTPKEIALATGLSLSNVYLLHSQRAIETPKLRTKVSRKKITPLVEQIHDFAGSEKDFIRTLRKVSKKRGYQINALAEIACKQGLIKFSRISDGNSEAQRLIMEGANQEDIGRALKEGDGNRTDLRYIAWNYLLQTGQYSVWKDERRQGKQETLKLKTEKKNALSTITSVLGQVAMKRARLAGFPEEKTVESLQLPRRYNHYTFDQLFTIFKRYGKAKRENKPISLEKLSEGTGIGRPRISEILRRVNLEPMIFPEIQRVDLTKEQIRQVERSYATPFTSVDLAYFIGASEGAIGGRLRKIGRRSHVRRYILQNNPSRQKAGYHHASLIYEFQDEGYTLGEISDLMEKSPELIQKAIDRRSEIEPVIILNLQLIKEDPTIDKPYLQNATP